MTNAEDTTKVLIELIRNSDYGGFSKYGYDIYLPNLLRVCLSSKIQNEQFKLDNEVKKQLPSFYDAAWELCRRGIIRPGVNAYQAQATEDGSSGNGYSITPFGRQWLAESHNDFVPTEPERFAQMLSPYSEKFGDGFHQRAQQAIRCYGAHAYLACCVMCGAAAESIMLSIAIAQSNETEVLKVYRTANGRSKIENMLIGKFAKQMKAEFYSCSALLKYWRDEASHGQRSTISENEAYTALALMLRFAMFVNQKWGELTKNENEE